jgi:hypothetical protein
MNLVPVASEPSFGAVSSVFKVRRLLLAEGPQESSVQPVTPDHSDQAQNICLGQSPVHGAVSIDAPNVQFFPHQFAN